jgi:hypothetical protein
VERVGFATPGDHKGEGKKGCLILREPITPIDVTPGLQLVGCTLQVRGASPAGRGAYPPGLRQSQFITGFVIIFSSTEKDGTGTGYRVMEKISQIITGFVIRFSSTEKVGTGTGYRVMKKISQVELSMD